jgi:hypothetical protein
MTISVFLLEVEHDNVRLPDGDGVAESRRRRSTRASVPWASGESAAGAARLRQQDRHPRRQSC